MGFLVDLDGMVVGQVISMVGGSWCPEDAKLLLFDAISKPIKVHVNGLGMTLSDGVIADSFGGFVVGLDWCG